MKQILKKSGLALAMLLISVFVMGQGVKNSGINGEVADQNGSTMPGATVLVVHQLSGTQYGTFSDSPRYSCQPVRDMGGPCCHQPKGRGEQYPEEMVVCRFS